MLISHVKLLRLASCVDHLARAAIGETTTDTCPKLNMGSTATSNSIPMSSSDPNSNPNSGLQPDPTSKSNLDSTFAVLGTNSTSTPITTSNNSISTATPTLTHNPRSGPGPGPQPGLASRPAHQAPIVSLPKPSGFVSSSSGAKSSFRPPAGRLLVRPDVVGDTGMGMDVEMDRREVDQGQGQERDHKEIQRQRQQELRLQEKDQDQRQDERQREDGLECQRADRIHSEVTSTRTSGEVAKRGVQQNERELRSQPETQNDCGQVRVDGIQGREREMETEQHRLALSPSATTIAGTPLDSSSTSTVIGRTRTQMGTSGSGTGQEVPGTTRLDPMYREATQLDLASVSPRRLLLSNQRLPTRLSPTYLDPLPNRSPIFEPAVMMSASASVSAPVQVAAEADGPVVVRSHAREAKLKSHDLAVQSSRPLDLGTAVDPPGNAAATVGSNAETSVEAVSSRMKRKRTSPARGSSLHSSTSNHHEPQNSRGGGKDIVEKPAKVTRTIGNWLDLTT